MNDLTFRNFTFSRATLLVAGLVGAAVGVAILLVPASFHATSGIELGGNISLLNETRASGGSLIASGALILAGAFHRKLAYTAALVATTQYAAYAASRVLSMAIDGTPHTILVVVAVGEAAIGLACGSVLLRTRPVPAAARTQSQASLADGSSHGHRS